MIYKASAVGLHGHVQYVDACVLGIGAGEPTFPKHSPINIMAVVHCFLVAPAVFCACHTRFSGVTDDCGVICTLISLGLISHKASQRQSLQ